MAHQAFVDQFYLNKLLTDIEPQYAKAAQALYTTPMHKPMRKPMLSQSSILTGIQNKSGKLPQGRVGRWLQRLRDQVPGSQSKARVKQKVQSIIATSVTDRVNRLRHMHLDQKWINSAVVNELQNSTDKDISRFARNSNEKVGEYVDRALNEASLLLRSSDQHKFNSQVHMHNLQARANDAVNQLQHRAFLSHIRWKSVAPAVREYLINDLSGRDAFGQVNRDKVISSVDDALKQREAEEGYTSHLEGARFKAFKSEGNARLNATQIRTTSGNVYALINTPTEEQARLIKQQHGDMPVQGGKSVDLGRGGFGRVRYAQNMETGEIVAVKKFSSHNNAKTELKELAAVGKGRYFVESLDYAHVQAKNKSGVWTEKSYVFTPLANQGDGTRSIALLASLRNTNPLVARNYFLGIAREYSLAIAALHEKGIYHHDIKPANFLHSNVMGQNPVTGKPQRHQQIKIGDYGLASKDQYSRLTLNNSWTRVGGTNGYFPPEGRSGPSYKSSKHDAFSLGMTLLEMKLGRHPKMVQGPHIRLSTGQAIQYNFRSDGNCIGHTPVNLNNLPLNCEDNIIAKLLNFNSENRLTPLEAFRAFYALEQQQ
ncbi:MAG: protein kinase [Gammaproteobacteria bacterium]